MNADRKRVVSPVLFLLVFVLFTLPFFSVSCQGTQLKSFTGYDVASGNTKIDIPNFDSNSSAGTGTTSKGGGGSEQAMMLVVLVLAAVGVALPFLPVKIKESLLISTGLGVAGVVILIAFAMTSPGQIAAQSQNMAEGKVEIGVWLTLVAMAAAGGYSFFLRTQGVDASAPIALQHVFGSAPAAGPPVGAPYSAGPVAPAAPVRACGRCGAPTGPGDAFCPNCGGPMAPPQAAPPAAPPQP